MWDFFLNNTEIWILLIFLSIALVFAYIFRNTYSWTKALGWVYIIWVFLWAFILPFWEYILAFTIVILSIYESRKILVFWRFYNILLLLCLALLLWGYSYSIISDIQVFLSLFVLVAFSDIVAYVVGKTFVWKKWFTALSPNKTLSWCLAQAIFVIAWIYFITEIPIFIAIIAGIFAPIGDLIESFFKRKAHIKDSADYIPGHWGILDRIDSSLFLVNFLLITSFLLTWNLQI